MAVDGLTTIRSSYGPEETIKRLEAEITSRGMTVFAHIDHAAGAAGVGLSLRPTDVLLFGNAKGGTPLMQSIQTIGIDLPLRCSSGRMQRAIHGYPTMIRTGSLSVTAWAKRLRQRSALCPPRLAG